MEPTMIKLRVLSAAAVMAVVLPTASFAQQQHGIVRGGGAPVARFSGGGAAFPSRGSASGSPFYVRGAGSSTGGGKRPAVGAVLCTRPLGGCLARALISPVARPCARHS